MLVRFSLPFLSLLVAGCVATQLEPYTDHDEASDFDSLQSDTGGKADGAGLPSRFDRNDVMTDEFFTAVDMVDGDGLQAFFESSPYGNRSWLADARVNGVRAADAIVDASRSHGINPIVMVARMQVEQSLVSKGSRPGDHAVNYAFGCGCPDNASCNPAYSGLDRQVACAADTLVRWYQASQDGTGSWVRGRARTSLDGLRVTPANHATASLYAYTPWVLTGRGGNWLVWNITRRFAGHIADQGNLGGSEPTRAIEVYWARQADGSYDLRALAASDVVRVDYLVDGYLVGTATRANGDNFPSSYSFHDDGIGRRFEVRGYDSADNYVALGVGSIDVTADTAVFIRQLGTGYYDIGLERAPSGVAAIEVTADGWSVTDEVSGATRSSRDVVRAHFSQLGARNFAISTFASDGTLRGTIHRSFTLR